MEYSIDEQLDRLFIHETLDEKQKRKAEYNKKLRNKKF